MADVSINIRNNGPLLVEGPISLTDHQGGAFPTNPDKPIALCRCGASKNRPFCDGAHRDAGFQCEVTAPAE